MGLCLASVCAVFPSLAVAQGVDLRVKTAKFDATTPGRAIVPAKSETPAPAGGLLPDPGQPASGQDAPQPPQEASNPKPKGDGKTISINFDDVDIRAFIKYISQITGKNFVVDEEIKGNVTVVSPQALSLDEAYKVFESVLEVHGFTTLPSGSFTKIVPAKTSRSRSMETVVGDNVAAPGDRMITQVIPLQNIRTPELRKVLTPLISPNGLLADYADTNSLIITDYLPNIQRLSSIINELDSPAAKATLHLFTLKHSSATKMAQSIDKLLAQDAKKEGGGGAKISVVPDERTNSLLVLAEPHYISQIKTLLAKIDVSNRVDQGRLRVYRLEHSDAENMAKVLNELVNKSSATAGSSGAAGAPVTAAGGFNFVADKTTNSLLVTAAPEDFAFVDQLVKKLDIPRKQVYVQAMVMEVSTDKAVSFGVGLSGANKQAGLGDGKYGGMVVASSNPGGYESGFNSSGAFVPSPGLQLGAVAFPVKVGEVVYSNLQALISANKTNNTFNTIATPQLMTLDNEEATITVAENRPYLTSQDVGQSTTDRPYQRYDYKDVGTTLKVTPQINEGNFIKLKIKQETSRIDEAATKTTGATQPITRKRVTETTVLVPNAQTIVLSGLIEKETADSQSKTPFLGDLPGVGWLFKNKSTEESRTNLYIFITPTITSTDQDNDKLLYAKKKSIEQDLQFDETALTTPIRKAPILFATEGRGNQ